MIPSEAIEVRKFLASTDQAFVFSTWLRNYKHSSYFAKRIRPSTFFQGHHALVAHILAKPTVQTLIACPKDDPETILGYLSCELGEKPVIHFTFVKEAFRKMGVARALFKEAAIDLSNACFTHWTYPVDEIIRKYPDMIYDPYRL